MNNTIKYFIPAFITLSTSYAIYILQFDKPEKLPHATFSTAAASIASLILIALQFYYNSGSSVRSFSR